MEVVPSINIQNAQNPQHDLKPFSVSPFVLAHGTMPMSNLLIPCQSAERLLCAKPSKRMGLRQCWSPWLQRNRIDASGVCPTLAHEPDSA